MAANLNQQLTGTVTAGGTWYAVNAINQLRYGTGTATTPPGSYTGPSNFTAGAVIATSDNLWINVQDVVAGTYTFEYRVTSGSATDSSFVVVTRPDETTNNLGSAQVITLCNEVDPMNLYSRYNTLNGGTVTPNLNWRIKALPSTPTSTNTVDLAVGNVVYNFDENATPPLGLPLNPTIDFSRSDSGQWQFEYFDQDSTDICGNNKTNLTVNNNRLQILIVGNGNPLYRAEVGGTTNPLTYAWVHNSSTVATTQNVYPASPGTYTVTVTDTVTNCTVTASVEFEGCGFPCGGVFVQEDYWIDLSSGFPAGEWTTAFSGSPGLHSLIINGQEYVTTPINWLTGLPTTINGLLYHNQWKDQLDVIFNALNVENFSVLNSLNTYANSSVSGGQSYGFLRVEYPSCHTFSMVLQFGTDYYRLSNNNSEWNTTSASGPWVSTQVKINSNSYVAVKPVTTIGIVNKC